MTITHKFKKLHTLLQSFFYILLPQVCLLCKKHEYNRIYNLESLSLCSDCVHLLQPASEVGVNWIYSIYSYRDENLKKIIYALKYYHKYDLTDSLMYHLSDRRGARMCLSRGVNNKENNINLIYKYLSYTITIL